MKENKNSMFVRLKNFSAEVPGNVEKRTFDLIYRTRMGNTATLLYNAEMTPPEELRARIFDLIHTENEETSFNKFFDYIVTPPPYLFQNLLKRLKRDFRSTNKIELHSIFTRMGIAASIMMVVISSVVLMFQPINNRQQEQFSRIAEPLPIKLFQNLNSETDGFAVKHLKSKKQSRQRNDQVRKNDPKKSVSSLLSVGDEQLTIIDNDILYSFASYSYHRTPRFINEGSTSDLFVVVDEYSNIYLTVYMQKILSDVYKVNSNNRPTRKARKAKQKIERWKETDAFYFDEHLNNNPLDPFCLGDFIFKQ